MYKVIFEINKGNRKLLKSIKGFKAKQEYNFSESATLLDEVYNNVNGELVIPFKIIDQENELEYIFDDFKVLPGREPDLMEFLMDSIVSSGHEDSQKILNSIELQYQAEVTKRDTFDEVKIDNADNKKKSSFLSGILNKKKAEEESVSNDFEGIDDLVNLSDESEETSYKEPVKVEEPLEETEAEELNIESTELEEQTVGDSEVESVEDPFASFREGRIGQVIPGTDENSTTQVVISDSLDLNFNEDETLVEKENEKSVSHKKHERVEFPNLNSYLDLMPVSNVIDRITDRIKEERLIGLLGIDTSSASELEEYKLLYAKKSLSNSKFKFLIDGLNESIKSAKEEFQSELSDTFNEVMLKDYDSIVNSSLESKIEELKTDGNNNVDQFSEKLDSEELEKKEKFELEQMHALESFKMEQELSKTKHFNELEHKKEIRLDLHIDTLKTEMEKKTAELIDEELYHEKTKATNQLTEQKRLATNEFIQELGVIEEDTWSEFKEAIKDLEKEMTNLLPQWELEIEKKRKLEAEAREERRKQEEINLKRQEIELEKQKLNQNNSADKLKEADSIASLVGKRIHEFNRQLTESQKSLQVEPSVEAVEKKSNDALLDLLKSKSGKTIMTGIAIASLALGGGVLGVKVAGSSQVQDSPVYYKGATNYGELEEMIRSLEKKIGSKDSQPGSDTETLDSLLTEKKYDRAMSLYKDPESVTKIGESLYVNRDLSTLVVFNKTFDTTFGKLDEAILSKDSKDVHEKYKSLSEKSKEGLSQERKSDIALHLFKIGEDKLANELLK